MCGICGFSWGDKKLVTDMCSLIEHRGPDQSGVYTDKNVSIGHRRLSIIDLSEKGKQPMHNEDKSVGVVFNGEIYNFKEIREQLEQKGHRFYSGTDTEVIVHSYEEFGEECVKKFNGCFSFAVYDSNKKTLFLARDRMGIKPLFYTFIGKNIVFASEIKSILLHPEVKREVCMEAVDELLTFRCNSLGKTAFKRIYKLLPSHTLSFKQGKASVSRYWSSEGIRPVKKSANYFTDTLLKALKESVKLRLMSDVPLGAYLSGGVDSGAIVAMMAKLSDEPVNTFTVGFGEEKHDETTKARFLADKFRTNHTEISVKMDASSTLPKVVWHLDEPMSDATCIPVYLMAQETKKHATVVLTGDGGDEQFIGYDQFKFLKLHHQLIRKTPLIARKAMSSAVSIMPQKILDFMFKYSSSLGDQGILRSRDFVSTNDYVKMYLSLVSIFDEREKADLFNSDEKFGLIQGMREHLNGINRKNYLDKLNYMDSSKILAEDFLMKVDKNTMAFGVEARVPLLDHNISELAASIPQYYKLKGMNDKWIFRRAASKILPKEVFQRKKDRFFVPIDAWLKGEIGDMTKQILGEERIKEQGYFNHRAVAKMFSHFARSPLYSARQQWTLLNFQMWHKLFIETDDFKNKNKIHKLKLDYFI